MVHRGALVVGWGAALLSFGGCVADIGVQPGPAAGPRDPGSSVEPFVEQCGNQIDDDGDAQVDEDCACTAGAQQSCYLGPKQRAGIGVCLAGVQACEDHFEFPSWGSCEGAVGPGVELPNGIDDDCDGVVDNGFDEGAETSLCPDGLTPTYRSRYDSDPYGASSIEHGDGGDAMEVTCEDVGCAPGQVAVEQQSFDFSDWDGFSGEGDLSEQTSTVCVEPPPDCPDGTSPSYRAPFDFYGDFDGFGGRDDDYGMQSVGEGWSCDLPCDLVVHYGALYGSLTVCTQTPELACMMGQVPTFDFDTEAWICAATCDNGLYDQIWLDGNLLCVPC